MDDLYFILKINRQLRTYCLVSNHQINVDLFSATFIGRFVLLRILKKKYPDLEFIKSVSIQSAMDTPDNTGYVVVLLKVIGDFDINLMKHTIQVHI